jgi:hypothetical protein
MKKLALLSFLKLAALISLPSYSQVPTSFGHVDCGVWLTPPNEIVALANKQWLNGYLSGLNAALLTTNGDLLKKTSPQQAWVWMDKYCRENPMSQPLLGGFVLLNLLSGEQQQNK